MKKHLKPNFKYLIGIGILLNSSSVFAEITHKAPLMGWSSWNTYGIDISENLIKDQADAMIEKGLHDVGFKYINIDDGYFGGRDEEGNLLFHPTRFPNGLNEIVEYIHSKGLKAGIYSDAGKNTCASFWGGDPFGIGVGLYGYDQKDMDLFFKELDFDFIKVDFCGGASNHNVDKLQLSEEERYRAIAQAIANTGKEDVILNACRWAFPGTWIHEVADSWRTTEDIYLGWNSVKGIILQNLYLSAFATNGRHNDMDMLEVGRGLTEEEDKTHFGMWCIMSSPLLIGCDMGTLSGKSLELLTNKEIVALNQDPLSLQAYVVKREAGTYVLVKDIETLHGTTRAIALYNSSDAAKNISIDFLELDLGGKINVRDLFEKTDLGQHVGSFSVNVPAHGTRIYKLEAEERYERTLYEAETAWLSAYQELTNNQSAETAIYTESDYCSGGAKANWLGRSLNNDLQWKNIYSREGGEYTMTLSYICNENRDIYIQINDQEAVKLNVNSGSWDKPADVELKINLNSGNNTIRLYHPSAWMPDIDCINLTKENSLEKYKQQLYSLQLKIEKTEEDAIPENIYKLISDALLQSRTIDENVEAYEMAIATLEDMISLAQYSQEIKFSFLELKKSCELNALRATESDDLNTLKTEILSSDNNLSSSSTREDLDNSLQSLHNATIKYLSSQGAIPVTGQFLDMSIFINNPTFDSNCSGWANSPTWGYGAAEYWNKNFDTYQNISGLKPGVYTLQVSALYRTGENDKGVAYQNNTEIIPAIIYANNENIPVSSIYSYIYDGSIEEMGNLDLKNGYINSMYAANKSFEKGHYHNSLDVEVTEGDLKIGISNSGSKYDSWCCFDNFKLLYRGTNISLNIEENSVDNSLTNVYSILGITLKQNILKQDALKQLPRGIYIINGEKHIIK